MKIKLIIWDLDETLWSGTLAECDSVQLFTERAALLRQLNDHGVVSSVCSKNDAARARQQLEHFELWDHLVFCRIAFVPKGEAVRALLEDIQLRAENTLFVDDNPLNLAEVAHSNPGILTLDAASSECDVLLRKILEENQQVHKSRVAEYRALEARVQHSRASGSDPLVFLSSYDIRVCLISRGDNMPFATRLEELINRTNQLNYLKTRIEPGALADYLGDVLNAEVYSVAVWDKFGYHGIVAVAAVESWKALRHFAFSCRIMHMGIEQWLLAKLKQRFTALATDTLGIESELPSWIEEEPYSGAVRDRILAHETKAKPAQLDLRVMASCQSGSIAHYSGLMEYLEFDNAPRQFELVQVFRKQHARQEYPRLLFYGAWTDYADPYWPQPFKLADYVRSAVDFCAFVRDKGCRMLVAVPPQRLADSQYSEAYGVTRERVTELNAVWRGIAADGCGVNVLELDELAAPTDIFDVRHYHVTLLKKLGEQLRRWATPQMQSLA